MRRFASVRAVALWIACASFAACDFDGDDLTIVPEFDDVYSFETDLDDWYGRGIDLGEPPIAWDIARTNERADTGTYAVRLRLDNLNDQGKIWIERRQEVAPDQEYEVTIRFALATADFGEVNLWRVLAGAGPEAPVAASGLMSSQDTGNGSTTDAGFKWVEKTVIVQTRSDEDGEIFVYVGIWGTSEFSRTYAVDNLRVTFMRRGLSAPTGPTGVL